MDGWVLLLFYSLKQIVHPPLFLFADEGSTHHRYGDTVKIIERSLSIMHTLLLAYYWKMVLRPQRTLRVMPCSDAEE